jgi:hypothetical protein
MKRTSSQHTQHSYKKEMSNQLVGTKEIKRDLATAKRDLGNLTNIYDPNNIVSKAERMLVSMDYEKYKPSNEDPIFKATTLRELDSGGLLTLSVAENYRTFGIDLMRKIQSEYACSTTSEKATAELAAVCFIRTLDIQRRITNYLDIGTFTAIGVQYVATLSKDLDRANRHYLTAIQTLRELHMPPMQVSIRTNTAVIGQNQIVQTNEINDPK